MWFLSCLWWWLLCDNSRENSAAAAELWQTLCGQKYQLPSVHRKHVLTWAQNKVPAMPQGGNPTKRHYGLLISGAFNGDAPDLGGSSWVVSFFLIFFLLLVGNHCLMTYGSSSNTSLNWSTPEKSYTHPQPPRLCACISPTLHFSLNRRLKRKKRNTFFELSGRPRQIPTVCSQKSLTSK